VAQRLIQLVISDAADEDLEAYCSPARILSVTRDSRNEKLSIIQMSVEAGNSEQVLDRLEKVFGGRDGFGVAVFPLEALLPRPQEPEDTENKPAEAVTQRISREELYQEVTDGLRISSTFLSLVLLSSLVAAIGLYRDDTAILTGNLGALYPHQGGLPCGQAAPSPVRPESAAARQRPCIAANENRVQLPVS